MPLGFVTALAGYAAVVLLVSGLSKLGGSLDTLHTMRELRVPRRLQTMTFAQLLPYGELVIAAGLFLTPGRYVVIPAVVATALFATFLGLTIGVVARREVVECSCFGPRSGQPVDWRAVTRNAVLTFGSVGVAITAQEGVFHALDDLDVHDWAWFFAATTIILTLALVGRQRSIRRRRIVPGETPIPDLEVTTADGRAVELASIARDRPVLLLVLSAECTACADISRQVERWQLELGTAVAIATVTSDSPEEFRRGHPHLGVPVYYGARALKTAMGFPGVPSAILLSRDGTIAAGPAEGSLEIIEMTDAIVVAVQGDAHRS